MIIPVVLTHTDGTFTPVRTCDKCGATFPIKGEVTHTAGDCQEVRDRRAILVYTLSGKGFRNYSAAIKRGLKRPGLHTSPPSLAAHIKAVRRVEAHPPGQEPDSYCLGCSKPGDACGCAP